MNLQRYSRQTMFGGIGIEGQKKLQLSKVAVIGVGATGTVIANNLCWAGVGFIRLIDRDYVELSNLQRQTLYTEEDAENQTPKAAAACEHLRRVNSGIELEPVALDVNSSNIETLISDVDLVLDGTDNLEIRNLINEASVKHGKPWIYAGVLAGTGMTFNIIPGQTPCLRCLSFDTPSVGTGPICRSAGVLNSITGIVASLASSEALKILIGSPNVRKSLLTFDIWENWFKEVEINKKYDCPVCVRHEYALLGRLTGPISICSHTSG